MICHIKMIVVSAQPYIFFPKDQQRCQIVDMVDTSSAHTFLMGRYINIIIITAIFVFAGQTFKYAWFS